MRLSLALLALAACARAEDLVCWRITAEPATISEETRKKPLDTFGTNDWGMAVSGPNGVAGCVPVEDGGSSYVEVEPSAALSAHLVDIDETELERASDAVDMKNAPGEQSLAFPEGSTVRFRIERFEPDKDSGSDVRPEGAKKIRTGEVHRDPPRGPARGTQLRLDEAKARIGEMAASDPDWKTKGAAERALRDWDRKRR